MIPENATIFKDMNLGHRPLSRLSYQIMGLNLIAVIILVMGIFYLDSYRRNLTLSETELLAAETELYGTLISTSTDGKLTPISKTTTKLATLLSEQKRQRLRLYTANGDILFDNQPADFSLESDGTIASETTHYPAPIERAILFYKDLTSINFNLPVYNDKAIINAQEFETITSTESMRVSAWQGAKGQLILSSIVPVYHKDKAIGYLVITRYDTNIARTFTSMRNDIFVLFFISLIITLSFSLYLSANIGHPLRFLASAAERSRETRHQRIIPDLSYRKDEIGDLSVSLRSMTDSLIQRVHSIEQFAVDVAHELKNPLASMRSAFETYERVQDQKQKETLSNIIQNDLHRMNRLITAISNASRLDAELAREVAVPVNLTNLLMNLTEQYKQQSFDLQSNIPLEPIYVWGTIPHLLHIFQNIFDNGFSFGTKLIVTIVDDNEMIDIHCIDNGIGIPIGKEDMIFNRFYSDRTPSQTTDHHSGLGLSIAKQIANSHGGDIFVNKSHKDNGADFVIRLRKADPT